MPGFTRPPNKQRRAAEEAFIAGAEEAVLSPPEPPRTVAEDLPWNDPTVRDDVLKIYNLRLPEPYWLKLKYISERTPKSMQAFCLDVLLKAIDHEIARLGK